MQGEASAIQRVPPGGTGGTAGNTQYNCQTIALSANTSSTNNNIVVGGLAVGGHFVTFVNIGTVETHIRFGVSAPGASTVNDFPIAPSGREEWWCTTETQFSAFCTAAANLYWFLSSP